MRRFDFTQSERIESTYAEHARILQCVIERRADEAERLLRAHIEASKAVVRQITLHRLQSAHDAVERRRSA